MVIDVSSICTPTVLNYIDPGTGSLVIQILIASLVGGLFMLKVYWRKVKASIFGGRKKRKE